MCRLVQIIATVLHPQVWLEGEKKAIFHSCASRAHNFFLISTKMVYIYQNTFA